MQPQPEKALILKLEYRPSEIDLNSLELEVDRKYLSNQSVLGRHMESKTGVTHFTDSRHSA